MAKDEPVFGEHAEFGIGVSNAALVAISAAGFCFLGYTMFNILMLRLKTREDLDKENEASAADYEDRLLRSDVAGLSRAERRARARAIMKRKRRVQPAHRPNVPQEGDEAEGDGLHNPQQAVVAVEPEHDPNQHEEENDDNGGAQLSRKERQKIAKALEKEERKLHEQERQKQQQEMEELAHQEKLERQKVKATELEQKREKQRLLKKEAERQHEMDYQTFLSSFDGGDVLLVDDWIQTLQQVRCSSIQELADTYNVSIETVRNRIEQLVEEKRVAGVVTERGHFVFVSDKELEQIAQQVRQKGVASKSDIAAICNTIVQPTTTSCND